MSKRRKTENSVLPNSDAIYSRRSALKKLVATTSIATGAPFATAFAQTNQNQAVLPSILSIILDEPEPEPTPESFTLLEDSYSGMSTQAFQINTNNQMYDLTATANICVEVLSSELNETRINVDMIVVLEGLNAINSDNSDIAIEYIRRDGDSGLLDLAIRPGRETGKTGIVSPARNNGNSCGYFLKFPLSVRIENFLPIVRIREQTKTFIADGEIALSLPEFSVELSPGSCNVPSSRTEQACELPPYAGLVADTTPPIGTTIQPF